MATNVRQKVTEELCRLGIPSDLARDLLHYFFNLAKECQTHDLEKSSVGKFVETVVQLLQALDPLRTSYDRSVKQVEKELLVTYESRSVLGINDEARLGLVRVARAIYALRSKRGIVHKNQIDPNMFDLKYIYQSAQWVVTELVRLGGSLSIAEAGQLVEQIQRPIIPIVEVIMGRPLVLHDVRVEEELLLILLELYTRETAASRQEIGKALDRRSSGATTNALAALRAKRLVEGSTKQGFRLTQLGLHEARKIAETAARTYLPAALMMG